MNETSSDQGAPGATATDPGPSAQAGPASGPRRLVRSRDGRVLGGVCAGLAAATGLDVAVVRLMWVLATVLVAVGPGSIAVGVFVYAAMWALLPDQYGSSPVEGAVRRLRGPAAPSQPAPGPTV